MVLRRPGNAFGSNYTFPGGVLDDNESEAVCYCAGRTTEEVNASMGLASGGLDYYCSAVRELFEETGVLLARDSGGDWAFSQKSMQPLASELRQQLDAGDLPWAELLRGQDLRIACDALHYFAFWVTPINLPRRWATRFFIAELPPASDAEHDGRELLNSRWMTVADVLSAGDAGVMELPYPTRSNLEKLSMFGTVEDLLGWASKEAARGIAKILPVLIEEQGGRRFVMPGDPAYPTDCEQ